MTGPLGAWVGCGRGAVRVGAVRPGVAARRGADRPREGRVGGAHLVGAAVVPRWDRTGVEIYEVVLVP
ncbi:hypothetical protein FBZ33_4060 [Micromonospora sp. A202]|nr:hypothetical protein FBZ33_4060 [Micromonospora sp. A202]